MGANKNSIPGDTSAINPGGIRLGAAALTSRGFKEDDFDTVAEYLHRGSEIAIKTQRIAELELEQKQNQDQHQSDDSTTIVTKKKKILLKDFVAVLNNNDEIQNSIKELRSE